MGDLSRRYKYPNNFRSFCCPKRSHVANEERGNMKWNIKAVSDFAIWGPQRECIYKTPCKRPEGKKHMAVILISNSLCQVLRLPEHIDCKTFMIHTELIGQSCILCIKRTCMGRKKDSKHNKSKIVVNNEACHCPANFCLQKRRGNRLLHSTSPALARAYLSCKPQISKCLFLSSMSSTNNAIAAISSFNASNILKTSEELFPVFNRC